MTMRAVIAAAALLLLATPAFAAGDAARGKLVFQRCAGCHSLGANGTGPSLAGVVGRRAGGMGGYAYSKAMLGSGLTWDEATLKKFLADPDALVPGTKMMSGAVTDPQQADDVIAYMHSPQ